ncbi:MAG TPA: DUF6603 domain-containing protein [Trebonia sp.]|jgi:hypothetical protein|nr:DUF6603 domain-containing protein [Trebonia sp.]
MPQTSAILAELLTALGHARQGAALVLSPATIGATSAAPLLDLLAGELALAALTLDGVTLPAGVAGGELAVSGRLGDVTVDLSFTDAGGEVACQALLRADGIPVLRRAFPALPDAFFAPVTVAGATATVTAPGLGGPLAFSAPRYALAGVAAPSSGLVTTSLAVQVEGTVATAAGPRAAVVQVQADIGGYLIAPGGGGWSFGDLGALLPGLGLLAAIPAIIAPGNLALTSFSLYLCRDAPGLSGLVLDIADATSPGAPLWTAAGGKIALTDVVVTLDLTYDDAGALALTEDGAVEGNFLLGAVELSASVPSPPTGTWSLTAYPDLELPGLGDIGALLGGDGQQLAALLPAGLGDIGGFTLSYLRVAVNAGTFSLAELSVALRSSQPWVLVEDVLELRSLQMSLTVDAVPAVTGLVMGVIGLPGGSDIVVSFGRNAPAERWRLAAVSAAVALPSLGDLAQLTPGVDLAPLVAAGGLDRLRFVMSDLNVGLALDPATLTNLGLTLQLANASDPLVPVLDWEIIPGVLTLTAFSFGFQVNWGASVTKRATGRFALNGLDFAIAFASKADGASADGLLAQYTAPGGAGTVSVRDLIASVAPGVAAGVPDGLQVTLASAALAYLEAGGDAKFLFTLDIAAGTAAAGLPLPGAMVTGLAHLKLAVTSAPLTAPDVAFVNAMGSAPVLPGVTGPVLPGFAFTGELTGFTIGQLIAGLASQYGITGVPEPVRSLELSRVAVSYQSATGAVSFDLAAGFTVDAAPVAVAVTIAVLPAAQAPAAGDPHVAVATGGQGYAATFTGTVTLAGLEFGLVFDTRDAGTDVLVADVVRTGGPVELRSLVAAVSAQVAAAIPPGISIDLEEVKFVFLRQAASQWAFGLRLGLDISLSDLPVVGSKLPAGQALALEGLQVLYASAALSAAQVQVINPLLPPGVTPLPATVDAGVGFDGNLRLGDHAIALRAAVAPPPALPAAGGAGTAVPPASAADPVKWVDVNQQFGIFAFQRIGVGYAGNVLRFALDASVSVGPLAFSMQALSVGSPLSQFRPEFSLQGLALAFDQPPIAIGGAFLKVREEVAGRVLDSYYGELIVSAATFSLKALGGWAPDADPASFFIYLAVNAPLGGPPFLYVTGLAAGFGINSRLILPGIDQVAGYPLLPGNAPAEQASPAETIKAVIPALQHAFEPLAGQYWLAAGIALTSFEMIQARAVISVAFGVDLQVGVVGIASMTFPAEDPFPVAYVEIDVVASFTPSTGLLAVDGKLSPASYLLGGFVKLTGGFAFYAWFSGPNRGDFVVSLGGYHPAFARPDNYPVVPRLGLAFSLGPLQVTGQAYFALTPGLFMAGLRLSATFTAGPVKAWFDVGVDFLIAWAPFHYEAHAWVTIGCSVDLGLFTLSVQIGADLQLWGPAFGGEALVDLDVVSFTIAFGAPRAAPAPVGWAAFASGFLPGPGASAPAPAAPVARPQAAPRMLAARAVPAAAAPSPGAGAGGADGNAVTGIVQATVSAGLVSQADGLDWILDPDQFRILTASSIPANHACWATADGALAELPNAVASYQPGAPPGGAPGGMLLQLEDGAATYSETEAWAPGLSIAPMGESGVASYHAVTLRRGDASGQFTQYVTGVAVAPRLGPSAAALWGEPGPAADPNAPRLIPATLTGLAISPVPRHPAQVADVPLASLVYGPGNTTGFGYTAPAADGQYTVTAQASADGATLTITVAGAHAATLGNQRYALAALADPWVASQRSATLDELRRLGFATLAGDAARVEAMARTTLADWPAIARIGSETWA